MMDHKFILRFAIYNTLWAVAALVAYLNGYAQMVFENDQTYITSLICGVFATGLGFSLQELIYLSKPIYNRPSILRLRFTRRLGKIRQFATSLVFIGLIGTVVGFIIALSGVSPESVGSVDAISPMISALLAGMSTALYTTLLGSILNLWLMMNYRILMTKAIRVMESNER